MTRLASGSLFVLLAADPMRVLAIVVVATAVVGLLLSVLAPLLAVPTLAPTRWEAIRRM